MSSPVSSFMSWAGPKALALADWTNSQHYMRTVTVVDGQKVAKRSCHVSRIYGGLKAARCNVGM